MMFYAIGLALFLLAVLIYLLGQTIGQWKHEAHMRERIKNTGFFMLENGLYRAVKVGIDTSQPTRKLETRDFGDVVETLVTPQNAFRQPENLKKLETHQPPPTQTAVMDTDQTDPDQDDKPITMAEPPKKPIRRRVTRSATA